MSIALEIQSFVQDYTNNTIPSGLFTKALMILFFMSIVCTILLNHLPLVHFLGKLLNLVLIACIAVFAFHTTPYAKLCNILCILLVIQFVVIVTDYIRTKIKRK